MVKLANDVLHLLHALKPKPFDSLSVYFNKNKQNFNKKAAILHFFPELLNCTTRWQHKFRFKILRKIQILQLMLLLNFGT